MTLRSPLSILVLLLSTAAVALADHLPCISIHAALHACPESYVPCVHAVGRPAWACASTSSPSREVARNAAAPDHLRALAVRRSEPLLFVAHDVVFSDGGTLSGSFRFDPATLAYSDVALSVRGPLFGPVEFRFSTGSVGTQYTTVGALDLCETPACADGERNVYITFERQLVAARAGQALRLDGPGTAYNFWRVSKQVGCLSGLFSVH